MTEKKDYYQILGISQDAGNDEVKAAYRALAKKYHPDVCTDVPAGEDRFKEISEAYEILIDEGKRKRYDAGGEKASAEVFGKKGFKWTNFTRYEDIRDIYERSTIDSFVRKEKVAVRGTDIRVDLGITLEECAHGVEKEVDVPYTEPCAHCQGTGSDDLRFEVCTYCKGEGQLKNVQGYGAMQVIDLVLCANCEGSGRVIPNKCKVCKGKGTVQRFKSIWAKVKLGSDEGLKIRLPNMGESGSNGGPNGDLYIVVHLLPHDTFRVEKRDIHSDAPVSFTDAVLGREIRVKTIWGDTPLEIPAGSQPGDRFRLKEMGLPSSAYGLRGDHIVTISIREVPRKLSARQKKILEEFAKLNGDRDDKDRSGIKRRGKGIFGWK